MLRDGVEMAWLAGGDVTGETRATVVLTTTSRTRGCLGFGLYRLLPTATTCTVDGGEAAAELRNGEPPLPHPSSVRATRVHGEAIQEEKGERGSP